MSAFREAVRLATPTLALIIAMLAIWWAATTGAIGKVYLVWSDETPVWAIPFTILAHRPGTLDHLLPILVFLPLFAIPLTIRVGSSRTLFLFFASGIATSGLQLLHGIASHGASGAVLTLAAAFATVIAVREPHQGVQLGLVLVLLVPVFLFAACEVANIPGQLQPAIEGSGTKSGHVAHYSGILLGVLSGAYYGVRAVIEEVALRPADRI